MAQEKTLNTRIQLKYDTYNNWKTSDLILKLGEVGICKIEETGAEPLNSPAIGIKVGDGTNTFENLPWIQAIAGDVAEWAKAEEKPQYTLKEIEGLEELVKDTNTLYKITTTDSGYKLQQKNGEEGYTDVAESAEIDLSSIVTRLDTLEDINVDSKIETAIQKLAYSKDQSTEHQFVTKVTQTSGVIEVTRAALTVGDLPSEIPQANIKDLMTTLGSKQNTLVFNTEYNSSTNKVATMTDITEAIEPLSSALHFKGAQEELPSEKESYSDGDVIAVDAKEYVFYEDDWHELGDETRFAVKGQIENSDIKNGAAIEMSKISGLEDALAKKVDSESLADIATSGEVKDLQQTDGTVLVFNCGDSIEST